LTFKPIFHKVIKLLSSIVKALSNPFLEPTSTKNNDGKFPCPKETTGAFNDNDIFQTCHSGCPICLDD